MEEKDIFRLISTFEKSSLTLMEISKDSFSIHLERNGGNQEAVSSKVQGAELESRSTRTEGSEPESRSTRTEGAEPESPESSQAERTEVEREAVEKVKSPIVGVFYKSPSPEQPAYVEVGQKVSKGQVLCLVEAMKMMNELKAPVDGEITAIYGKDGELAEYGQVLFEVKPC